MLKDIKFKPIYNSDYDNLLEDFLIPVLKVGYTYDRQVGYWSSNIFKIAAEGLSVFIKNKGKIRLLVGTFTDINDYDALNVEASKKEILLKHGSKFNQLFENNDDELNKFRIDCLSWLVASNQLEVKVAYRPNGIFHAKDGIIKDKRNSLIAFSGSANDSRSAFDNDFNYERINVYKSWAHEDEKSRCNILTEQFEELWNNKSPYTRVFPLDQINRDYLLKRATKIKSEDISIEKEVALLRSDRSKIKIKKPQKPKYINGSKFEIYPHQIEALYNWKENGKFKGIFALATGTGKTITSIFGAIRIYKSRKKLCLIVAVPYIPLADQWLEELRIFNIIPLRCYEGYQNWESDLKENVSRYKEGLIDFLSIVVVNNTLISQKFQNLLKNIDSENMMIIGDECHHHGSKYFNDGLPKNAEFKLGLSATPDHYLNEENNKRLAEYYGKTEAKFELQEAIEKKILCPYEYHIINVRLTLDEQDEYREISKEIGKAFAISGGLESPGMKSLIARRTRLLGNAENKIIELENILRKQEPEPYTLFYCAEGSVNNDEEAEELVNVEEEIDINRQTNMVSELVHRYGWKSSRFTSREARNIKSLILEDFKEGSIDALVAMKCLDEGIDIPLCKTAFILASSNNPRQFIQRRGRILRKHKEKEKAIIYDFFVSVPIIDPKNKYDVRLIEREVNRINEFSRLSLNPDSAYNTLGPLLEKYGLEEMI